MLFPRRLPKPGNQRTDADIVDETRVKKFMKLALGGTHVTIVEYNTVFSEMNFWLYFVQAKDTKMINWL